MMNNDLLHHDFKWNSTSFSNEIELIQFVDDQFPELKNFIREWFGDRGVIYAMTSGSTGEPKKIRIDRQHMINSAKATGAFFDVGPSSAALLCLPLGYIAGRMMLIRAMVLGWHLDTIAANAAPEIPLDTSYDFSAMVPMQLFHSWDQLHHIKTLIVGGGEVADSLKEKLQNLSTKIYATYGMTETITHVALMPLNKAAGYTEDNNVFTALPGIHFSVDKRQCLRITAPGISFKEVATNDIVELISSKSFKWVARVDHVINSGGVKLIPELIERKFNTLIRQRFFVDSLPDKVLGEKLVMMVENDNIDGLLKKLEAFQRQRPLEISKYEVPKEIFFVKKFVQTETGKINRNQTMNLIFSLGQYELP
jgi:O-succinylbenzoic acid--CoA ligase